MIKDLANKTAIVTAASRGIGLAIAEKLVEEGAVVYMAVRDSEKNRQLTARLHEQNENFRSVFYDAFDFATYAPMIQEVVQDAGHLDILVNNFGTTDVKKDTTLVDGDSQTFFDIVDKNIASVYYTSPEDSEKHPVIELDFAKNKKSSYKGRTYHYFRPDFSLVREVSLEEMKKYDARIYAK